tara:strand:- start:384 stop:629 length:246 start_codon:yes stop_codon:yes gene_type:complete
MYFDTEEFFTRLAKYLVEGIVLAMVAYLLGMVSNKKLNQIEILTLALVSATIFALLDTFLPAYGSGARGGAALGAGLRLFF